MKKIFALFLACMMIFSILPTVVFAEEAGSTGPDQCTCDPAGRTGVFQRSVAPSCVSVAYDVYKCNTCSLTYTVVTGDFDLTNHVQMHYVAAQEPTCTEGGWYAYEYCDATLGGVTCTHSTLEANRRPALGHSYSSVVTAPTCTEAGYTTHTCSVCNDTYIDTPVAPLDHDYVATVTPPTCTTDGYTTHTCSRCSDSYTDTVVEAPGHEYVATVTPPTCTADGYTTHTCSACGNSYTDTPVPALGHAWVETARVDAECYVDGYIDYECTACGATRRETIAAPMEHIYVVTEIAATCTHPAQLVYTCRKCGDTFTIDKPGSTPLPHTPAEAVEENRVDPTCVADGSYDSVVYCSVCGDEISRTPVTLPASGHTEVVDPAVPYTCTTDGLTEGSHCSVCYTVLVAQTVISAHHNMVQIPAQAPTCSSIGWNDYQKCSVCGELTGYVELPSVPTNHHSVILADQIAPTCVAGGWTYKLGCNLCGQVISEPMPLPIDPDAHQYTSVVTAPTCTVDGYTTHTCTLCGDIVTDTSVPALGHDYEDVVTAPTCTVDGYTTHTCSVCGDSYTDTVVPAPGHTLVDVAEQAPTCTAIGWADYQYCSECDYTTYVEIPATGHSFGTSAGVVPPTCTEGGYRICKCGVCDEIYQDTFTDALGHTIVAVDAQAPTCTTVGWDAYEKCSVCDYTTYVEIPALGHTYVDTVTAPTCTVDGFTTHTCSVCGDTYNDTVVPATGHTPAAAVEENRVPATCTVNGAYDTVVYCSVCDAELSRVTTVLPATGHSALPEVTENRVEPTCTVDGSYDKVVYCSVCDAEISRTPETIPATGHTVVTDAAVAPTFDTTGLTEGSHCAVCNEVLVAQTVVPTLNETVKFTYKALGINGVDVATNSGYITLNVYMNVLTEQARLWGVDLHIAFGNELKLQSVIGCIFDNLVFTNVDTANAQNLVKISQTLSMTTSVSKTFARGEYLFATLTFKVADDFHTADTYFNVVYGNVARDDATNAKNALNCDFAIDDANPEAVIHVIMLGDANGDGVINSNDALSMSTWATSDEVVANRDAYSAVYDMNKDGVIDGADFDLLRNAVVGNDDYLTDTSSSAA